MKGGDSRAAAKPPPNGEVEAFTLSTTALSLL
jgi:hypothetical protein